MVVVCNREVSEVSYGMHTLTRAGFPPLNSKFSADPPTPQAGLHYGTEEYNSLQLVKEYFTRYAEHANRAVLSVEGGYNPRTSTSDCSGEISARHINVFEPARLDPNVPIEDIIDHLAIFVELDYIEEIGLTEVSATTIRKAHRMCSIAAVKIKLSLFCTDVLTNGIMNTCKELGIPLTDAIEPRQQLQEGDWRLNLPRFDASAWGANSRLAEAIKSMAERKGWVTRQLALVWVKKMGAFPIPGSRRPSDEDMAEIASVLGNQKVMGERFCGKNELLLNM
ncbi:Aldo/keto reductase [Lepidopterella palustris CBS 459.81]|uniref:Aldo/keto reductase n=1 Tax=Lepidopterella palustris CBS 459.81 TaxID=1314670 RepID=A0A8E2E9P1_9PEZI|nr:Aldo/keto reductase [Lepidopterella palustris CBS 459.81]